MIISVRTGIVLVYILILYCCAELGFKCGVLDIENVMCYLKRLRKICKDVEFRRISNDQFHWEMYLVRPVHPSIEKYTKLNVGNSLCFDEFW